MYRERGTSRKLYSDYFIFFFGGGGRPQNKTGKTLEEDIQRITEQQLT